MDTVKGMIVGLNHLAIITMTRPATVRKVQERTVYNLSGIRWIPGKKLSFPFLCLGP
jgi:hypothetical protein